MKRRVVLLLAIIGLAGLVYLTSGSSAGAETGATLPVALKLTDNSDKGTLILSESNSIALRTDFNDISVPQLILGLKKLDALQTNDPVYLVLSTPGGSILVGRELIATINSMRRPVSTLTIFAASMGFMTVEISKGERLLVKGQGVLMAHKAKGGFQGEFPGQIDSRLNFWKQLIIDMDEAVALHTNGKHSRKSYEALSENEYWCSGETCINEGFADKEVNARCEASMSGQTEHVVVETAFMQGHQLALYAIFDKCGLNTGLLGTEITVDGKPLTEQKYLLEDTRFMYTVEGLFTKKIEGLRAFSVDKMSASRITN